MSTENKPKDQGEVIREAGRIVNELVAAEIVRDVMNTAHQEPVEPPIQELAEDGSNLERHLKLVLECREKAAQLEAQLENASKAAAIAENMILEKMLEQGVDNFRALGKSVTRTEFIRATVRKEDRPRQIEWLQEIGAGGMVEQTVNSQSFGALVRNDYIKQDKPVPEFVSVYREPRLMIRSA